MDTFKTENNPLTIEHIKWLGMKNENGAFVREGLEGEVQYYDGAFHYCVSNKEVKELKTEKDLNDLIIPIANAEIAVRNKKVKRINLIEEILERERNKKDVSNHRLAAYIEKILETVN